MISKQDLLDKKAQYEKMITSLISKIEVIDELIDECEIADEEDDDLCEVI